MEYWVAMNETELKISLMLLEKTGLPGVVDVDPDFTPEERSLNEMLAKKFFQESNDGVGWNSFVKTVLWIAANAQSELSITDGARILCRLYFYGEAMILMTKDMEENLFVFYYVPLLPKAIGGMAKYLEGLEAAMPPNASAESKTLPLPFDAADDSRLIELLPKYTDGTVYYDYDTVYTDEKYTLPECMFDAPEGQKFKAWLIGEEEYLPGQSYTFTEDTIVEAVWEVDYEKRTEVAIGLIEQYVSKMTEEEKEDPTDIDIATLYAEAVVADAISADAGTGTIHINKASSSELAALATKAAEKAQAALIRGGVIPHRELSATFTLNAQHTNVQVQISPDVLESDADKIRVQTSKYALTFNPSDLEDDLAKALTIKAKSVSTEARRAESAVDIDISGGSTGNPITVALPTDSGEDDIYQTMADANGNPVASKVNPVTRNLEGKVNTSGTYKEITNEVNFTDIANKSAEMQKAIKYLAAKGVLGGTGDNKFSPDDSISRAELTKLVVMALGKLDNKATTKFSDVTKKDWFYAVVASSQKLGYSSSTTMARLCPYCGHKVEILCRGTHGGTYIKCPKCGESIFFPPVTFRLA